MWYIPEIKSLLIIFFLDLLLVYRQIFLVLQRYCPKISGKVVLVILLMCLVVVIHLFSHFSEKYMRDELLKLLNRKLSIKIWPIFSKMIKYNLILIFLERLLLVCSFSLVRKYLPMEYFSKHEPWRYDEWLLLDSNLKRILLL